MTMLSETWVARGAMLKACGFAEAPRACRQKAGVVVGARGRSDLGFAGGRAGHGEHDLSAGSERGGKDDRGNATLNLPTRRQLRSTQQPPWAAC